MTTTYKFRAGALLLALSAAAVGSGAAQAAVSQTQNWNGGSEGAKDVSWAVVKQSEFSFTVTPVDISSVGDDGYVNGGIGNSVVGSWRNGGGATVLSTPAPPDQDPGASTITVFATGDKDNALGGREYLAMEFVITDPLGQGIVWDLDNGNYTLRDPVSPLAVGRIDTGQIVRSTGDGKATYVSGLDKVNSSKFVLHLTAKQNTP